MKKLKNILTDYWVGTIAGAMLIATSIQSLLFALTSFYPQAFRVDSGFGGDSGYLRNFLIPQLASGILTILVGILILAIRRPKP